VPELSHEQRQQWDEQGCLLLHQVLSPGDVVGLLAAIDRVADRQRVVSQSATGSAPQAFKIVRAVEADPALDLLIDHPETLPVLMALLGPSLQVLGTEIFIRRPGPTRTEMVEWHTDGGPALGRFVHQTGVPPLQLKIQYFLTDLSEPESGNFLFVPGSHAVPFPGSGTPSPDDRGRAVPVLARPGDALVFSSALWHSVAANHSDRVRLSITFRWGQLFCRPYDFKRLPPELIDRWTPRQRRLFGLVGSEQHDYYYTDEADQLRFLAAEMNLSE
jgi:phytanoyl-CoA hydroxylase